MKQQLVELKLPDSEATPQEIAMWEFELVPGVNVPRDQSLAYHLSSRVVKTIDHCLENKQKNP